MVSAKSVLVCVLALSLVAGRRLHQAKEEASLHSEADGLVRLPLLSKIHVERRIRGLQESPQEEEGRPKVVDALYQGYGEHYVDLWCGMPPQRQTLIVGTGSSGTAFPCSGCHDCGEGYHTDNFFNDKASNSYHQLTCNECALGRCSTDDPSRVGTCNFGMSYQEGSRWEAVEAKDHCYIGGLHDKPTFDDGGHDDLDPEHASAYGFSVNFGCQTVITGLFRTQLADGILGMDNANHSFWRQMYDAGKIQDEIFSLCYVRQPHVEKSGTEAGAMTLGGSDDRLHLSPMVFTDRKDSWGDVYAMYLRKIYLREGGDDIVSMNTTRHDLRVIPIDISVETLNEGPVFIESGTTDTFFISDLRQPFSVAWNQLVSWSYSNMERSMTYEEMMKLPTIIIQFEGSESLNSKVGDPTIVPNLAGDLDPESPYDVVVAVPPHHYMEKNKLGDSYTPRFYMEEPPWGGSTIGSNVIMGHDVLFDMKNRRIGWAESNCNYEHLIEKAGYDGKNEPPATPPVSPADPSLDASAKTQSATEANQPVSDPLKNTAAEKHSDEGFCASSFCRVGWFAATALLVVGIVIQVKRESNLLDKVLRGITGRSEYSTMITEETLGGEAELELRITHSPELT